MPGPVAVGNVWADKTEINIEHLQGQPPAIQTKVSQKLLPPQTHSSINPAPVIPLQWLGIACGLHCCPHQDPIKTGTEAAPNLIDHGMGQLHRLMACVAKTVMAVTTDMMMLT
jgi:hypothetical protein